jgi:2-hydroxy-3-keto-5-methylthiopentenyl-1-phosphate phosphatase
VESYENTPTEKGLERWCKPTEIKSNKMQMHLNKSYRIAYTDEAAYGITNKRGSGVCLSELAYYR